MKSIAKQNVSATPAFSAQPTSPVLKHSLGACVFLRLLTCPSSYAGQLFVSGWRATDDQTGNEGAHTSFVNELLPILNRVLPTSLSQQSGSVLRLMSSTSKLLQQTPQQSPGSRCKSCGFANVWYHT